MQGRAKRQPVLLAATGSRCRAFGLSTQRVRITIITATTPATMGSAACTIVAIMRGDWLQRAVDGDDQVAEDSERRDRP